MRKFSDLRADQQSGIDELFGSDAAYVVMRMGGGKTVTALTSISELLEEGHIRRAFVLAPPLVAATVWPREAAKWEHLQKLKVVHLTGGPKQRLAMLAAGDADVYAVSDGLVGWLVDWMEELPDGDPSLDLLVYDEPKMKQPTGKIVKRLCEIGPRIKIKWNFSGTPRPNGYQDLFGPARFMVPDLWGKDFVTWRRRNFMQMDHQGYDWEVHDFRARQLDADLRAFMSQAPEPPGARHGTLSSGPDFDIEVELPGEARKAYKSMERDMIADLRGKFEDEEALIAALSRAAASSKLAQLAQGFMYQLDEATDENIVRQMHDAKEAALVEALRTAGEGETSVITYGFRHDLSRLEEMMKQQGRRYGVLGGGISVKQKMTYVDQWNEGRLDNLLLHPASAGHGVELQFGGRRMFHYCPTWSTEQYDQVLKRLDRPGQERQVYSHQIIATGTVDIVKRNRVHFKMTDQDNFRAMLRGTL